MSDDLTVDGKVTNKVLKAAYAMHNGDVVTVQVDGFTDPLNAFAALRFAGSEEGLTQILQQWKIQNGDFS